MKSIKRCMLIAVALFGTLILGACGSARSINADLDNGDEIAITTELATFTNQELFEAMAFSFDHNGINNAVLTLIDLVDHDILSDLFDIDSELVEARLETFREIHEDDFEAFLIRSGFASEDDLIRVIELEFLREEAINVATAEIEITEEEIEEFYEMWYQPSEEESSTDEYEDDDDVPSLEEVREEIKEFIMSQRTGVPGFNEATLAELRQEAGFTILNAYIQEQYIIYLEMHGVDVADVFEESSETSRTIIAQLEDTEYSANTLFEHLLTTVGVSIGITLADPIILAEEFDIDRRAVNDQINELKVMWGDRFFPFMRTRGLETDQEIFDHIAYLQLQETAFTAEYEPSEERLRELYEAHVPETSARHILVHEEELAKELIERLEDADDLEALFIELAREYSTCPSADDGGNLGSFGAGRMDSIFEEAAFALAIGAFTNEPVSTSHGYHIIYVYDREEDQSFDELRDFLKQSELERLMRIGTRMEAVLIRHRQNANLRFENEFLQQIYQATVDQILDAYEELQALENMLPEESTDDDTDDDYEYDE